MLLRQMFPGRMADPTGSEQKILVQGLTGLNLASPKKLGFSGAKNLLVEH